MSWNVAGLLTVGLTLLTSGWVANTLSTMRISKRISKASKAALWIHGIHGIVAALDPIEEKEEKKP